MKLTTWTLLLLMTAVMALAGILANAPVPLQSAAAASPHTLPRTATATPTATTTSPVYLSLVMRHWPPLPYPPELRTIDNADQNNNYTVSWRSAALAKTYILEEATTPSFTDAGIVYQGPELSWSVPSPGKSPGTYYYRVRGRNERGSGPWSDVQRVVIQPLFVGLELRWDGTQYQRAQETQVIGEHITRQLETLEDADTVRISNHIWYDPNPRGWESQTYVTYYSVVTGYYEGSDEPADNSNWKWGYPWILPYDWQLAAGQTVDVAGQAFRVSGPVMGQTAFEASVEYWELVNQNRFLAWADGGPIALYAHAGDITLHYDAGNSRLLLHSDALFRLYHNGVETSFTLQDTDNLTDASVFPSSRVTLHEADHRQPAASAPIFIHGHRIPEEVLQLWHPR